VTRSKRKSSINVAVDLVKAGTADAVVSAGNTGAAVASTVLKLRTLPGIERPGISTIFPTPSGHFVLLDAGSTVDCKPMHLVHYAIMGDVYQRHILGTENPRIGLLNVGDESVKGNDLTKQTFKLLSNLKQLNFIGNVEGHDLFTGDVDVVVCDGFVGNVVLKTCESLAGMLGDFLKNSLKKTWVRKFGYLLSRGAYQELRNLADHAEWGGAPLLGVNGVCIIGHGSSSPKAVRNAIRVAGEFVQHQVNTHIVNRVQNLGLIAANTNGAGQ
jgi:glycerol-3-phosphate acyltransferase PlsX